MQFSGEVHFKLLLWYLEAILEHSESDSHILAGFYMGLWCSQRLFLVGRASESLQSTVLNCGLEYNIEPK